MQIEIDGSNGRKKKRLVKHHRRKGLKLLPGFRRYVGTSAQKVVNYIFSLF